MTTSTAIESHMRATRALLPDTIAGDGNDSALGDRLVTEGRAEAPGYYGSPQHAADLARLIERDNFGEDWDGIHLGPSDARLCVAYLRRAL